MKRRLPRGIALVVAFAATPTPLLAQTTQWAQPTHTQQVDPARMENPEVVARPGPLDPMLVGTWDLWVPGGAWYSSDGRTIYRNYTPGAAMNRLVVRGDGAYQWGTHPGRLVEVRPWFAQDGERYFAVAMDASNRYMARYDAGKQQLLMFFWGVGGHAATGTRIGAAPAPSPVPAGERPATPQSFRLTGTATNSGTTGTAVVELKRSANGGLTGTAGFSGGLGGHATLRGTLRGEHLSLAGELFHSGVRYTMIVDGRLTAAGELTATYSLTALDGAGVKQGGTLTARTGTSAAGGIPTAPVPPVQPRLPHSPPADPQAPPEPAAGSVGNPLGVTWVGGDSSPPPAADPTDPCDPGPLGIVWAQCQDRRPATEGASSSPLAKSWRFQSLMTRDAAGAVQDFSAQVQGTLTLGPDGSFTQDLRIGTREARRSGTYRVEGERLIVRGSGGQSTEMWFRLEGGSLLLQEEQGGTAIRYGLVSP